jgi:hypothetical protein
LETGLEETQVNGPGIPILALIIGVVLGAVSGIFAVIGMVCLAPVVILGSIIAFVLSIFVPPLRMLGVSFLMFSVGLVIGIIINGLLAGLVF